MGFPTRIALQLNTETHCKGTQSMMNSYMPKGRGMIKWQAFASLPEQFQGIQSIIQEQTKIEMPLLDSQQLEEIECNIQQAILSKEEIHLSYFRNGHIQLHQCKLLNISLLSFPLILSHFTCFSQKRIEKYTFKT
ncbi:YolD-like family protein (plasmid) [Bacillus mycoides]|nr:YolD-like family protein [Bacillus mycoides]QWJ03950.1 YolD-like family protein [Bacillus mycoides]